MRRKKLFLGLLSSLILATTVGTFVLWATHVRLPAGIDAVEIDRQLQALSAADTPAPSEAADLLLEELWRSLEDREGRHFFVDSEVSDTRARIPAESRERHHRTRELLVDGEPQRVGEALRSRPRILAQAFIRIANRALIQKQIEIAIDYLEGALILLVLDYQEIDSSELLANGHARVTALRMLKDASVARSGGEARRETRELLEQLDSLWFPAIAPVEKELIIYWDFMQSAPPTQGGFWTRARLRREIYVRLGWLCLFRELFHEPPGPGSSIEPKLRALPAFQPTPTIDGLVFERSQDYYWKLCHDYWGVESRIRALVGEIRGPE